MARANFPGAVIFPGEEHAVRTVLAYAEFYGYGNLIAHLRRGWALKLMKGNKRLDYERAMEDTAAAGYAEKFDLFDTGI